VSHNFRLGGGQERLATHAGLQRLDVSGAQVVQERHGVRAGHLGLAVVRPIKQGGVRPGLPVLDVGPGEVKRHQPAGLFGENRTGRCSGIVKRTSLGHGWVPLTVAAGFSLRPRGDVVAIRRLKPAAMLISRP